MSKARKILKYTKITIGSLLGTAIFLYLVVVIINWTDQPQSTLATATLENLQNRPTVENENNANILFLGFSSPPELDSFKLGVQRSDWLKKSLALDDFEHTNYPYYDAEYKFELSTHLDEILKACGLVHTDCSSVLEKNQRSIDSFRKDEVELFDRYSRLVKLNAFQELIPHRIEAPFPAYSDVFKGQGLYHLYILKYAGEGKAQLVRDMLEQDIQFWRMILANSDILISKMIAISGIKRHFQFGNLILKQLDQDNINQAIPPSWTTSFNREERSLKRSFSGEWIFMDQILNQIQSKDMSPNNVNPEDDSIWEKALWALGTPFFQLQDTSNLHLERLMALVDVYDVEYNEVPDAVIDGEQLIDSCTDTLYKVYNFVGNILTDISCYAYSGYFPRVTDIEGIRRAALVIIDLRTKGIVDIEVNNQLSNHEIREPYWGNPFVWDEDTKSVVFEGLEPNDRGQHRLLY